MKASRFLQFCFAIGALALIGTTSMAQMAPKETPKTTKSKADWSPRQSSDFDPAKRAEQATKKMTKVLGLDESQKAKVLTLNTERLTAMKASIEKAKASKDRKTFNQERKDTFAKFDAGLKGVLTADQLSKYQEMKSKVRNKVKAKMESEGMSEAGLDD
jgi:hypothetical protein